MGVWVSTVSLLWAGLWAGTGHGAAAVLASQADQGSDAQALLRARKALPRWLAWLPVINLLAIGGVSAGTGEGGSPQPAPSPGPAPLCARTVGPGDPMAVRCLGQDLWALLNSRAFL